MDEETKVEDLNNNEPLEETKSEDLSNNETLEEVKHNYLDLFELTEEELVLYFLNTTVGYLNQTISFQSLESLNLPRNKMEALVAAAMKLNAEVIMSNYDLTKKLQEL